MSYGREVRKLLKDGGCTFERRGKGDHDIWYSPHSNRHVTVDTDIKSRHTANEVLKQAGLAKAF
jgi:predicted RNA binding protein YcfA (HicA-like mRNA interferase family)